jgi:hypothetical protein
MRARLGKLWREKVAEMEREHAVHSGRLSVKVEVNSLMAEGTLV